MSKSGLAASRRMTSGYCSTHMPVMKNVAGMWRCSRISMTVRLAYDTDLSVASLAAMPVVMSASKVSATALPVRGPLFTTGGGSRSVKPGGTVGSGLTLGTGGADVVQVGLD